MVTRWLQQHSLVLSLTWLSKRLVLTQRPQEKISAARPLSFFLPRHALPSSAPVPEVGVRKEHHTHTKMHAHAHRSGLLICKVLLGIRWKTAKWWRPCSNWRELVSPVCDTFVNESRFCYGSSLNTQFSPCNHARLFTAPLSFYVCFIISFQEVSLFKESFQLIRPPGVKLSQTLTRDGSQLKKMYFFLFTASLHIIHVEIFVFYWFISIQGTLKVIGLCLCLLRCD